MKKREMILLLVVVLMVISSCATTGASKKSGIIEKEPATQPKWVKHTEKIKSGSLYYFFGESHKSFSRQDAVDKAVANALSKVSNHFGVKVSSELVVKDRETDGKYSYDIGVKNQITGAAVVVKKHEVAGVYIEKWQREKIEYDAKVRISIPVHEMARMQMEMESLCGWTVISNLEADKTVVNSFIKEFAGNKKINLKPSSITVEDGYSAESISKVSDTAYFLVVKFDIGDPVDIDGEWYANVQATVEYISLLDRKVIDTFSAEAKGGAYSGKDAIKNGISKVVEQIMFQ